MRAIILAAGQGTRLRPLTDDRPKCLVDLCGVSLLERQTDVLRRGGVEKIIVVGGYLADRIAARGFHVLTNEQYASTNMVASLFCAEALLDGGDDVLVAYGDIVYEPRVLEAVATCTAPIGLAVDTAWRAYWSRRFADPLADAETLRLDATGHVVEVGKKPTGYEQIEAQYLGLFKIRADEAPRLGEVYRAMDAGRLYDGQPYEKMYMTSFLQHLIETGHRVQAVPTQGGWLEVDSLDDLRLYHALHERGELKAFFNVEA